MRLSVCFWQANDHLHMHIWVNAIQIWPGDFTLSCFAAFALGFRLLFHLDSRYGLCSGKFLTLQWEISVTSASERLPWLPPSIAFHQHSLAYCRHCLKLASTLHFNFKNRFDLTCPFNSSWNKGHRKLKLTVIDVPYFGQQINEKYFLMAINRIKCYCLVRFSL